MLSWYQFRKWLEHFGVKFGKITVAVNPAYTSQNCVRFVLEKLRNERIPGSNRVTFGLSSHFKPLLDDNLIVMWVRESLKSHTVDVAVKALPPGSRLAIKA
jgi:Transposase and inactivated derivatives